jgi:hypothetical protein
LAAAYEIQIATDAAFGTVVDQDELTLITRYVPQDPLPAGNYYWRVRARAEGDDVFRPWSETQRFEVESPAESVFVELGSDWPTIQAKVHEAVATPGSQLKFAAGEYRLTPGDVPVLFDLENARNITIEATDATFVFTDRVSVLRTRNCDGVLLLGGQVDFDPLPFTGGVIDEVYEESGAFDITLLDGHPTPDEDPLISQHGIGMLVDLDIPGIAPGSPVVLQTQKGWERLADRRYRVRLTRPGGQLRYLKQGLIYVDSPRAGKAGFDLYASRDIAISGMTTHALAGIGVSSHYVDDLKLLNLHFAQKAGRVLGVQNGGTNMHNGREGPWVEGCRFENTGDDNNHINALVMHAVAQPEPDQIVLPRSQFFHRGAPDDLGLRVGDRLMFFSRQPVGRSLGTRRVVEIEPMVQDGVDCLAVGLDGPIEPFSAASIDYWSRGNKDRLGRDEVQIYNLDQSSPDYAFRNNRFTGGRRIGILTKGGPGLIEDNVFADLGAGAVEGWNAPLEGPFIDELVIQDNLIERCGVTDNRRNQSFGIWITGFDRPTEADYLHKNILIRRNTIRDYRDRGIGIFSTENITVEDNRFENDRLGQFDGEAPAAIHTANVSRATIGRQSFADDRLKAIEPVRSDD